MIHDLIEYLGQGRCLVLVGAGPSIEIGLPSWDKLAEKLLHEVTKLDPPDLNRYEELYAQKRYEELFDRAWRSDGSDLVISVCKSLLVDTGESGAVYEFLVTFGFKGFLTTNFDNVLLRHCDEAGIANSELLNTKEDLATVDFERFPSIVKIHGDLEHPDTLILTESQYDAVIYSQKYRPLRKFLEGYFISSHILFVGYSLGDKDLQYLSQLSAYSLRRKIPLFALVANASPDQIEEWDRKYNIRIISYKNPDGKHSELKKIFQVLQQYIPAQVETTQPTIPIPLEVAQHLFIWSAFQQEGGRDARKDAFQSLILSITGYSRKKGVPFTLDELVDEVADGGRLRREVIRESVENAARDLAEEGLLVIDSKGRYCTTESSKDISSKYAAQFDHIKQQFSHQVLLDIGRQFPKITKNDKKLFEEMVLNMVLVIFGSRGVEIAENMFQERGGLRPTVNLYKTIHEMSQGLPEHLKYEFIRYVTEILSAPQAAHARFLEYLSRVFFVIQALGLDPDGAKARLYYLENHTLLVDSTVLIPLLAQHSSKHGFMLDLVRKISAAGIGLITTKLILDETFKHASWASNHIERNGVQSIEILSAALGRESYGTNEFLDGYIRSCADTKEISFSQYMEESLDGPWKYPTAKSKLESLGIEYVNPSSVKPNAQEFFTVRETIRQFIEESAEEHPEIQKSSDRIETEAEAYATIHDQQGISESPDAVAHKCSFLSQTWFLNRVAHDSPHPLGRDIIVRPDMLYELLTRLEGMSTETRPLCELLLLSTFRAAQYFIDKEKYGAFFTPLIRESEKIYADSLQTYRDLIDSSLTTTSLTEVPKIERPFAVESLTHQVEDALGAKVNRLDEKVKALEEENKILRKEAEKSKNALEKAGKKKKYVEKQARLQKGKTKRKKKGRR